MFLHAINLGVNPLAVAFPWIFSAFAGTGAVATVVVFSSCSSPSDCLVIYVQAGWTRSRCCCCGTGSSPSTRSNSVRGCLARVWSIPALTIVLCGLVPCMAACPRAVAVLAASIFSFRAQSILEARDGDELHDIMRELSLLKVVPLLQHFLFTGTES